MNPRDYDPPQRVDYLCLLNKAFRAFPRVSSQEELAGYIGPPCLTDVSDLPEFRAMEVADPLPPGFTQRVYQFRESTHGRGVIDAAFDGEQQLANFRAQLFFAGWRAKSKARKYYEGTLGPTFRELFGPASDEGPHFCTFHKEGLIRHARYVPGTPSVSAYFTDERYA